MPNGLAGSAQVSYPLAAPNGTAASPSYAFAASSSTGLYRVGGAVMTSIGGTWLGGFSLDLGAFMVASSIPVAWAAGHQTTPDLYLYRDAANVLAQRNSTNGQAIRIYNTTDGAGNAEFTELGYSYAVGQVMLLSRASGTGVVRQMQVGTDGASPLYFRTNGSTRWQVNADGHFLATTDNTYDIGANGATRPRTVYAATSFRTDGSYFTAGGLYHTSLGSLVWTADGIVRLTDNAGTSFTRLCVGGTTVAFPAIKRDGSNLALVPADGSAGYIDLTVHDLISNSVYLSNIVSVGANNTNIALGAGGATHSLVNSAASFIIQVTGGAVLATFAGTGYLEMYEVTAPSAPAANTGRIYFEDNGAGKTRLMCLFASGSAQQLAIEP